MKKIWMMISACLMIASVMAARVSTEMGVYNGTLTIDGMAYTDEQIYLLPGTQPNTLTCVVGSTVRVNVPLSSLSLNAEPTDKNYDFVNGGFEGAWTNNEPQGWHSFGTATGNFASFVTGNTAQFSQATDTRPGSDGSYSAKLQSKSVLGVKANGNCTNGRINAGSMTADDAANNYNFSDPSNTGYNTPFAGQPDSLVFWAKYIPADKKPANSSNMARAHAVITTNAHYQDPEATDYSSVKIADAEINYAATSEMDWQRLSVPFTYYSVSPDEAAFMLMTFATNAKQGGGTTSGNTVDNIYLDDVQMVYNYGLKSVTLNGQTLSFTGGQAAVSLPFSEDYAWNVTTDGKGAKVFIGYDAPAYKALIYIVPDNYAQALRYAVYTVQMTEPEQVIPTTTYTYSATTCANEPYSDDLFRDLTISGEYRDTLPNAQGGDSIVTLTLTVLPAYLMQDELFISEQDTSWRGQAITGLVAAETPYIYWDSLTTRDGCDSVYQLSVYVSTIPRTYGFYTARVCEGDSVTFEGVTYTQPFEGDILLEQLNQFGGDSIVHLSVEVLPHYFIEQTMTIVQGADRTWEGMQLGTLPAGTMTMSVSYFSLGDCDSTLVLHLTVLSTYTPKGGKDTVRYDEVYGRFDGTLTLASETPTPQSVYLLPGTVDSTVTFVLPDFQYNGGRLGHIVVPNIPIDTYGQLRLVGRTLFLDAIQERATITLIAYSGVTPAQAQMTLYIETPSLPEAMIVTFQGQAVRQNNYMLTNGGFEGAWTNSEPEGWHSFGTATGNMADFVKSNTAQMVQSTDIRPESAGSHSVLLSSTFLLGVKANGNCTNGQINASSSTAADATKNYNFSDPSNLGFNTPFHGRPDSLVFWAKYLPADRDASNAANKARVTAFITTDARYQDPDAGNLYSDARIGAAEVDYSAVPDWGWQRIAVPFTYAASKAEQTPAFILTTFTTNAVPGGGSSYSVTENQQKRNVLDSVYVDDVEAVYNKQLNAFYASDEALVFADHVASIADTYCDDCETYRAVAQGVSTKAFVAFDPVHRCIYIYVIADDYAQNKAYNIYRVEFSDSQTDDLHPITLTERVEQVSTSANGSRKVLHNGQIRIIREDGSMFDILGRKIQRLTTND